MVRVLVAEDMAVIREGLVSVLAREPGLSVVAQLERGDEVVEAALVARPDVAVLDLSMPGTDGISAARQLAGLLPGCRVLILTVLDRPGRLREARDAGVAGYLLKSASAREVVEAIHTVAEGGRAYDPRLIVEGRRAGMSPLTQREADVLQLAARGAGAAEIAAELFLSVRTIRNQLSSSTGKLNARTLIDAVRIAERYGWI
jgi:two-component system response regulator DesR